MYIQDLEITKLSEAKKISMHPYVPYVANTVCTYRLPSSIANMRQIFFAPMVVSWARPFFLMYAKSALKRV